VALQHLPSTAREYQRAQRREITQALAAIRRQWRRMPQGSSWDDAWARIEPTITQIVKTAQRRVATGALAFVPAVIEATDQDTRDVDATVTYAPLIGTAGDGRPVDTLAYGAVVRSGTAYDSGGVTPYQALTSGGKWLNMAMSTVLADTARSTESLAMGVRRVRTYVRMVAPGCCARCAILAGQVTTNDRAFLRHPACQCRNIPMQESIAGHYTVDPHAYFESLTAEQQDHVFTAAGAEAIRNGADMNQVVNARRGMASAQVGGRKLLVTSEGTTRRGFAYHRLRQSAGADIKVGRYGRASRPRLMPETIRQVATSQEECLRLLYANGYIL
jgi:hypothetical protein